jgi:hypothetical protein
MDLPVKPTPRKGFAMPTVIPFDELRSAFDFVSAGAPYERNAYIAKATGEVFQAAPGYDAYKRIPPDVDDSERYWSVPHRQDLGLAGHLELKFVQEQIPAQFAVAEDFFHRRGAHAKFHDLVAKAGMQAQWRRYEHDATEQALRKWAHDEGLALS